jgi:DNA-binding response OmpR family regulator
MGQHALIADPEAAHAAIYAGILKQEGFYSVIVKDNSAAVSALLERGPPVLAVVDLSFGLEMVERIRRSAPVTALPIIVVSALRAERDLATAHRTRLGLGAILAKAASEESFRRVARRLLGLAANEETDAPPATPTAIGAAEGGSEPPRADSGVRRRDDAPAPEARAPLTPSRIGSRR